MSFGITVSGFAIKPLETILTDIQTKQLQGISPSLDLSAQSIMGILNGIIGQEVYDGWLREAALYSGMDPDNATGDQLTSLALITGTTRLKATPTQVLGCTVNVNNGFSAAPGTMFASIVDNATAIFTNKTTVTNVSGIPANRTVDFEAVSTGKQQCLAGTLTVISQPLTGWNSITNPSDGLLGTDIETDADLRTRRQNELSSSGKSTADAIRSAVLNLLVEPLTTTNTTGCTVLFNDTDATDSNGVPPHSIEVIARQPGATGADDQLLGNLLLNQVAAGVGTHGLTFVLVVDEQNNTEQINFTRPVDTNVYLDITVKVDPNKFPINGDDLIKNALVAYGNQEYEPGSTVYASALQGSVFQSPFDFSIGVPGVLSVTLFKLDTHSTPTSTSDIPIDIRHIAVLSTSRISVHHA